MAPTDTLGTFFADRGDDPPRRPAAPAVEPPAPEVPALTVPEAALVAEACTRSGVAWLRPPDGGRSWCVWHVWHEDAVHVVHGVGEQTLPHLTGQVELSVPSKDTGARLVTVLARAELLTARSPQWEAAADALSARRLNATDPAQQRERWASGTMITRFVPLRLLHAGAGDDATPSGAAPVPPAEGTTTTWRPFHLGDRGRRAAAASRRALRRR